MTDQEYKQLIEKAGTAVTRARLRLLQQYPFWAYLVRKLELVWDENAQGGVSCTDGERLYLNPAVYTGMTRGEQQTVLVHEAWHCAAGHLLRARTGRYEDQQRANLAMDITIANGQEAEHFELIKMQEQFFASMGLRRQDYAGLTWEQIYEKLPKSPQGQGGSGKGKSSAGAGKGASGAPSPSNHWNKGGCCRPPAPGQRDQVRGKWRQAVIEAGQLAGNLPGHCQELVKAAMPKPPFHLALWEHLQRGMGGDASWTSVNRRFAGRGMYLPTELTETMGRVAWICDTSGSMGQAELRLAFGYGRAFRAEHPCEWDMFSVDCGVAEHRHYEEWEELPAEFNAKGRGGTSFNAPFEMIREKRIEPVVAIYVTDGFGECSCAKPAYPVLWVLVPGGSGDFKPPFGRLVRAEVPDAA